MRDYRPEQENLVEALVLCPTLETPSGREDLVRRLRSELKVSIDERANTRQALLKIVETCSYFSGGVAELLRAVEFFEKGKEEQLAAVRECANALMSALKRERGGGGIGPTETSGGGAVAQLEAGYALSIGISRYLQFDNEQNKPLSNPFPDLSFAADDAKAFHEFLRERGYQGPEPLLNEKATRNGIMRALDGLWKVCREATNPLVLIFFSGHGARDADDRHYLVPHDGMRDDLFATGLWSKTFESALRLIDTNRLIVFLDACHAAGMEPNGVKGGLRACHPESLLEEKGERKMYVVASCLANQLSRECDGHGIFSNQLLRLLRCEKEEDSEGEQIELYGLFVQLRERVKNAARDLPDKPVQEPWTNAEKATDIILAINQTRRKARERRELTLLEAVNQELRNRKHKQSEVLRLRLLKFITGPFVEDPLPLELYFRQMASNVNSAPPSLELIYEVCEGLDYYLADKEGGRGHTYYARDALGITGPRAASARPEPTRPQATMRPAVPSQSPTRPDQDASERLPEHPSTSVGLPTSAGAPDRRCLPSEDVSYLLEHIRKKATKAKYSGRIALLKRLLTQSNGMSEKEFKALQLTTCSDGDTFWAGLVDELGERFESRWPKAFKPGAWACSPNDLTLPLIAVRLRQLDRLVDKFVAGRLLPDAKEALDEYRGEDSDRALESALACCLNTIIHGPSIWDEHRFDGIELRQETAHIRTQNPQGGANLEQLNRMLLEDAYPDGLRKQSVADPLSLRRGRILGDQGGSDA